MVDVEQRARAADVPAVDPDAVERDRDVRLAVLETIEGPQIIIAKTRAVLSQFASIDHAQ